MQHKVSSVHPPRLKGNRVILLRICSDMHPLIVGEPVCVLLVRLLVDLHVPGAVGLVDDWDQLGDGFSS